MGPESNNNGPASSRFRTSGPRTRHFPTRDQHRRHQPLEAEEEILRNGCPQPACMCIRDLRLLRTKYARSEFNSLDHVLPLPLTDR